MRQVTEPARVRQQIYFKEICEQCGRNKRLAVLNEITAMNDAAKVFWAATDHTIPIKPLRTEGCGTNVARHV